ncbi:nephrocystin-1-like [Amphiura filiformis]|uniref:nephrocystin-1-like n=1 Tax=Amphiura filiformis TaxID=82378 RepID=UPI003B20C7F0
MGAIPSGFRPSTTAKLLKDDQCCTLSNFLKPELSESNLAFRDLFWSPHENQIRSQPVRIQKMLSLMMVKNMPQVGVGIEIKSRHVRLAIFDGEKILSNIHTVQATYNEADGKTWRFSPKVASMLPSAIDGECFVRTNYTEQKIGLLFELCLSYVRTKTGEKGEFSCGWVHLPLYDENTGAPIFNKVYDLPVKGGTPYEQDVEVDPSISRKASTGKLRSMLSANKKPMLQFKLVTPTKEQKTWLDVLPETLISSTEYLPFLSYYRILLADALLRDRIDLQNTDLIHSPLLANFPKATKFPDIMDALRMCWIEKKRTIKKKEMRDAEYMKSQFTSAFMESAYPLLFSPTLPQYKWADVEAEQDRWNEISRFMKETQEKGILHSLLAAGTQHTPFDMSEVTYDLLEAYNGKR